MSSVVKQSGAGVVGLHACDEPPAGASDLYKVFAEMDNYSKEKFPNPPKMVVLIHPDVLKAFTKHVVGLYQFKVTSEVGDDPNDYMIFKFLDLNMQVEESANPASNVFFLANDNLVYVYNVETQHRIDLWDQVYLALPRSKYHN